MAKSFSALVIGDPEEKKAYRRMMRRVNALPADYCYAYKKIQRYLYNFEYGAAAFDVLLELFEAGTAQGKPVLEVVGSDVAGFCDELLRASAPDAEAPAEDINQEILEHFGKEWR